MVRSVVAVMIGAMVTPAMAQTVDPVTPEDVAVAWSKALGACIQADYETGGNIECRKRLERAESRVDVFRSVHSLDGEPLPPVICDLARTHGLVTEHIEHNRPAAHMTDAWQEWAAFLLSESACPEDAER